MVCISYVLRLKLSCDEMLGGTRHALKCERTDDWR